MEKLGLEQWGSNGSHNPVFKLRRINQHILVFGQVRSASMNQHMSALKPQPWWPKWFLTKINCSLFQCRLSLMTSSLSTGLLRSWVAWLYPTCLERINLATATAVRIDHRLGSSTSSMLETSPPPRPVQSRSAKRLVQNTSRLDGWQYGCGLMQNIKHYTYVILCASHILRIIDMIYTHIVTYIYI